MAICASIIVFVMLKKHHWKPKYGLPIFLLTIIPAYVLSWCYVEVNVHGAAIFAPYNVFRIHFFLLVFLVPASHLINFFMILAFAAEACVAWFYFDFPSLKHVALAGEPQGLIVSFVVSITILFFRFRDEQIIRALITKEARSEVVTQIARTFLSIRDRSNTPLQTLTLATELLKKRHPEDQDLIHILDSNVEKLKATNKILTSLESKVSWQGKELMNDDEILSWLAEFKETSVKSGQ
jgi:hypothetical protein